MAFYLRKSFRLGPVRFNLSKSGIGTSVGVTGFRIGVRPNGKSYVHAGRYGLYYRKELGPLDNKNSSNQKNLTRFEQHYNTFNVEQDTGNTSLFNCAPSKGFGLQSRKELLDKLNKSYKAMRIDYVVLIASVGFAFLSYQSFSGPGLLFSSAFSMIAIIFAAKYESKKRTVRIFYEFEDQKGHCFELLIKAFNDIAQCHKLWVLIDKKEMIGQMQRKINAGAKNIVNRNDVKIGESKPPWIETNVSVPAIGLMHRTFYFMPDGILVYDVVGVGFIEYESLKTLAETTHFIEEKPPEDAHIVDFTWKYVNKNGGPDRRFKDNYKIPVCLYGLLYIDSTSGLSLVLMLSNFQVAKEFCYDFNRFLSQ
jgi:hypothetical protein